MKLQQAKNYTTKLFSMNWVKWVHEGSTPANRWVLACVF